MKKIRPFLKWAGGKYSLLEHIVPALPNDKKTFIEPFVGSGAVFLNTNYEKYVLNDINSDLINLYKALQAGGNSYIEDASYYFSGKFNNENKYYALRNDFNSSTDSYERAVLFLFLNRHCYNGLIRYNKNKQYNVPFGRYKKPYFPDKELHLFFEKSKNVKFHCLDFSNIMEMADSDSVIYCDPPYIPLTNTAKFTTYSSDGFNIIQQELLAKLTKKLSKRGVKTIISNHDTLLTRLMYREAKLEILHARRSISSKITERKKVNELLAIF